MINTLILADVGEKAIGQLRDGVKDLVARSQPPDKAEELAGRPRLPITFEEAQRLWLKVSSDMPLTCCSS